MQSVYLSHCPLAQHQRFQRFSWVAAYSDWKQLSSASQEANWCEQPTVDIHVQEQLDQHACVRVSVCVCACVHACVCVGCVWVCVCVYVCSV